MRNTTQPGWSRRSWLSASGALGLAVLGGCTAPPDPTPPPGNPTVTSSTNSEATPPAIPPTPDQIRITADALLTGERNFLRACDTFLARSLAFTQAQRANLSDVIERHRYYAQVLVGPDPLSRQGGDLAKESSPPPSVSRTPGTPTSPTSGASGSKPPDPAAELRAFVPQAQQLAKSHRRLTNSTSGTLALLVASLAAAALRDAAVLTRANEVKIAKLGKQLSTPALPDPDAAASAVLAGVHAAVWGYQTALAEFPGQPGAPTRERLRGLRALRDDLTVELRARGVEIPIASPAYDLGTPINSTHSAAAVMSQIESRLAVVMGPWIATSEKAERSLALDSLTASTLRSAQLGPPAGATGLALWPGWPD